MLFDKVSVAEYKYILELCDQYQFYSDLLFEKVKDIYEFIGEEEKSNYKKMILQNKNSNVERENIKIVSEFKKISALHNLLKKDDYIVKKNFQKIQEIYYKYKYGFDKIGLLIPENANNLYYNKIKVAETISILEMMINDNKKK